MSLQKYLQQWCKLNKFETRMFRLIRNAFKYGDQIFIRDPETKKLFHVDAANLTKIIVNESEGKTPEQYIVKDFNLNFGEMVATTPHQTNGQIKQVPISAVASSEKTSTFSAVKRKNQTRMITIMSNVLDGYNANEVVAEIKKVLQEYPIQEENTLKFTGQQEEQAKEMSFLGNALMIAVFLIFLILVSQFNSASTPFIIVISVVFSLIGVFLGLVTFRMDFVVIMTMIGIISLAGIVVNNAIVLIDYTKLIMERKADELGLPKGANLPTEALLDSLVEGGKTRLRPVLLTAITTILGLLPLATGMNIDFFSLFTEYDPKIYFGGDNVIFWGPMSWTVIFGLTFATFLTLVIVPVMFFLLTKFKYSVNKNPENAYN